MTNHVLFFYRTVINMSYTDSTYETHTGMECPDCGCMVYEYTQYWGVNLSDEEREKWEAEGPHAAFDCPLCGIRFHPDHL